MPPGRIRTAVEGRIERTPHVVRFTTGALIAAVTALPGVASAILISEFAPNPPGDDPAAQLIEFSGTPGKSGSAVLVSIDGDGTEIRGTVDSVDMFNYLFADSGLFTLQIPDLENPTFTLVLASAFDGTIGTDLDGDDDGTLDDVTPFGTVFDAVGVADRGADLPFLYAAQLGGVDLQTVFEPVRVFRDGSVGEFLAVRANGGVADSNNVAVTGPFSADPTIATFGAVNPTTDVAEPAGLALLGIGALAMVHRRRRSARPAASS